MSKEVVFIDICTLFFEKFCKSQQKNTSISFLRERKLTVEKLRIVPQFVRKIKCFVVI